MGITSAMYTGISGLNANGEAISVVGNNLANSNTIGFKTGRMLFSDVLSSTIGNNSQIGHGVQIQAVQNLFGQGTFETTQSGTDLGIQGDSFFVVKQPAGSQFFTRAGAFNFDNNKIMVNPDGYQVQGFGINQATGLSNGTLGAIDLTSFASMAPKMTSNVTMALNLNSTATLLGTQTLTNVSNLSYSLPGVGNTAGTVSAEIDLAGGLDPNTAVGGTQTVTANVFDNQGFPHAVNFVFTHTAADVPVVLDVVGPPPVPGTNGVDNWSWTATIPDASSGGTVSGTAQFNTPSSGGAMTVAFSPTTMTPTLNGAAQTLALDATTTPFTHAAADTPSATPDGTAITLAPTAFDPTNVAGTSDFAGTPITIYDNSGNPYTSTTYYSRTAYDTWTANTIITDQATGNQIIAGSPVTQTLTFDNLGVLKTQTPASATVTFASGQPTQTLTIDAGVGKAAMTGAFTTVSQSQDGVAFTAATAAGSNFSTGTTVYDSQGNPHTATVYFRRVGDNAWDFQAIIPDATAGNPVKGTLTFDASGVLTSQNPGAGAGQAITFAGGVTAPQSISLDFSKGITTQYSSASNTNSITQDGSQQGSLTKVTVDPQGYVIGAYSNGQSMKLAQVALANFASTTGLSKVGSTLFEATTASGLALISSASSPGVGTILSNSLEQSTVDMATEFVKLIQYQRAYAANAKTITTADEMTQEVLQLKR